MRKSLIILFIGTICSILISLTLPATVNALTITNNGVLRELSADAQVSYGPTDSKYDSYSSLGTYQNNIKAEANYMDSNAWATASQDTLIGFTGDSFYFSGNLTADSYAHHVQEDYYADAHAYATIGAILYLNDTAQYSFIFQDNLALSSTSLNILNLDGAGFLYAGPAVPLNGTMGAGNYYIYLNGNSYVFGGGSANIDFSFNITEPGSSTIPEPATIMLLGLGLIGLTGVRRKFQK